MNNQDRVADAPRFDALGLDERILSVLESLGFAEPTPIQQQAIAPILSGANVLGRARTGSGKTAAFGLPLLQRIADGGDKPRALILAPTRELALQVTTALRSFARNLPLRVVTIYGGTPYRPQLKALEGATPIVVGTPGRVLDHLERGSLDLSELESFVLDEADELLRMGFIGDVEKILDATPEGRQVVLFSATMPREIQAIVNRHCPEAVDIHVEEKALTVDHVKQRHVVVPRRFRLDALARVLEAEPTGATLVFARTRAECAEVADELAKAGVPADALHGDLNQGARERVLHRLRSGQLDIVVATDVAARGIDVNHITHVINLELPNSIESYVHRIGRTGRAGREGVAITLIPPHDRRRIYRYQQALSVSISELEVPSDARIAERKCERLAERLCTPLEIRPGLKALYNHLSQVMTPTQMAMAALSMLSDAESIDLSGAADEQPPSWVRPPRPPRANQRGHQHGDRKHGGPRRGGPRGESRGESQKRRDESFEGGKSRFRGKPSKNERHRGPKEDGGRPKHRSRFRGQSDGDGAERSTPYTKRDTSFGADSSGSGSSGSREPRGREADTRFGRESGDGNERPRRSGFSRGPGKGGFGKDGYRGKPRGKGGPKGKASGGFRGKSSDGSRGKGGFKGKPGGSRGKPGGFRGKGHSGPSSHK